MPNPHSAALLLAISILPPLFPGPEPSSRYVEQLTLEDLAEIGLSRHATERAVGEYRKYLLLHPDTDLRPKIELMMARCHLALKDYARAKAGLERAYRSALESEDIRQSLLLLGRVDFGLADFRAAMDYFSRALGLTRQQGERSEILFWQARCLCGVGDPEGGHAKFASAASISPYPSQRGKIAYFSGLEFAKAGRSEKAEQAFREAVLSHPFFVDRTPRIEGVPPEALAGVGPGPDTFSWIDEALYALAFSRHLGGDPDRAFEILSFVPRYFPDSESSAQSHLALGVILSLKREYVSALSHLAQVRFSPEESELGSRTLYLTGVCHYRSGELEESTRILERLVSDFPQADLVPDGLLVLGEAYYEAEHYAEARRAYRRLLSKSPVGLYAENASFGIAWSHYREGSYREAVWGFRDFMTRYPQSGLVPSSKYMSGRSWFNLGDYAEAITGFEGLLREYPNHHLADDAQYLMGRGYLDLKDSTRAVVELKKLTLLYPDSRLCPSAHKFIGDVRFERGQYREAVSAYQAVESPKAPSHLLDEARYQIERAYYRMGVYQSPLDVGRNFAIKYPKSPRSPELQFEVGEYYFRGRRYSEAIPEYERVIDWFPWSSLVDRARERVAQSFLHLGDHRRAIATYRLLTQKDPPLGDRAQFQIGEIHLSAEDFDSAIREFQRLIREFPRSPYRDASQYNIGISYRKLNRPEEARLAFDKLISDYPSSRFSGPACLEKAKTYYQQGDVDGYLAALIWAVENTSGRTMGEAQFLLGQAYSARAEFANALNAYVQAAESYGDDLESAAKALFEAGRCAKAQMDLETALTMFERAAALLKEPQKLSEVNREIAEIRSAMKD